MMNKTKELILGDYCELLAAREPVPGGGSVCGVYSAIGSALALMVIAYTLGKEKFEQYRQELEEAQSFFVDIKVKSFASSDADIESYGRYSAGGNERDLAVIDMIKTPLDSMSTSVVALERLAQIKSKVNPYLINDFLLARQSFVTAFLGSEHNLKYNLDSCKDTDFKEKITVEYKNISNMFNKLNMES